MHSNESVGTFADNALPPEGQHSSREQLRISINDHAAKHGYAFIAQRSKKTVSGKTIVIFVCDRGGGQPPPPGARAGQQRETVSRRTGCKFSIIAAESTCRSFWSIKHRDKVEFKHHNHEPSTGRLAHLTHRQLSMSTRDVRKVHELTNAGIAPREIRSYLQQNSSTIATRQDIMNCIIRGKQLLAHGQSNIHALAEQLDSEGFWNHIHLNNENRVTAVLFAHPQSLGYLKLYLEVFIIDCTYKTNKYKMPLLDIVGVDSCQRTFCIAFAFLSGEEEGDFAWVLQRLRHIYEVHEIALPSVVLTDRCLASMNALGSPSCFPEATPILCIWYINKAIVRNCRAAFIEEHDGPDASKIWDKFYDSWHKLVASPTKDIYDERIETFKQKWAANHAKEVAYVLEVWLDLHKRMFVKA